jgi:hypothetical protein
MDGSVDLLPLAVLLERAYRLALVVHDDLPSKHSCSRQAAVELVDVLDDARVSLFNACRSSRSAHPPPPGSSTSVG